MTQKQIARDVIDRLPDDASLEDIMQALYFREMVERGLEDIAAGRVVSHEEAKRRLSRWLSE